MSPEKYQNRKPIAPSTETVIKMRSLPSWETVNRSLELKTHNDIRLKGVYHNHRGLIKDYYDAQLDIITKKGSDKLNEFWERYNKEMAMIVIPNVALEDQPKIVIRTHFKMIRQSLGIERKRTSHGFAKHERARKAAERK